MRVATSTVAHNLYAYSETRDAYQQMRAALIELKPWSFSDSKKAEIDKELVRLIGIKYKATPKAASKRGVLSMLTFEDRSVARTLNRARSPLLHVIEDKKAGGPKRKPQLRTKLARSAQPILDCILSGDERQQETALKTVRALMVAAREAGLKL